MSRTADVKESTPAPIALIQMTVAGWVSKAIYVAAKLGIADLLEGGPATCEDLAAATHTHEPSLYRVLRALASVGIFAETDEDRFVLTPMADHLRSNVPGSMRAWATMAGEAWHWALVGNMLHSVKTGESAFDHVFGMRPFEFFARNREDGEIFDQAMTSFSAAEIAAVVEAYDFSRFKELIDVGGGHGSLLVSVLKRNKELKGVLYELAPVAEAAKEAIRHEAVEDRCRALPGDFFESIPQGGDAYMMKHIIHDWSDDDSLKIMKNCRNAMAPNSTLLLIEMVIPSDDEPFFGKFLDLEMLLIGGRERTETEYQKLFETAGFKLTRIVRTHSPVSVIEGVRL